MVAKFETSAQAAKVVRVAKTEPVAAAANKAAAAFAAATDMNFAYYFEDILAKPPA